MPRFYIPSRHEFEAMAFELMGFVPGGSESVRMRRIRGHFGLEPSLMVLVWRELAHSRWLEFAGRSPKPVHLLWALLFLKTYSIEEVHAAEAGVSERTFRKWAWFYAKGIARLDQKFVSPCFYVVVCLPHLIDWY